MMTFANCSTHFHFILWKGGAGRIAPPLQPDRACMSRRKGRNETEKKIKEEKGGHKKRRKKRRKRKAKGVDKQGEKEEGVKNN
jgi:hypothetical protein